MSTHAVTLQLPISLYEQIRSRARRAMRPVETEVLNLVATAIEEESLPDDMAAVVESLNFLDDDALWRAARSALATESRSSLKSSTSSSSAKA